VILLIYIACGAEFSQKNYIYKFLFQKYPISKTKHPNWKFGSEDIANLKSAILRGFHDGGEISNLITFDGLFRLLPNQFHLK